MHTIKRIITILILLAVVPIVSANYNFNGFSLETVRHETLSHGGVYVCGGHGADVTPYTETFEVPDGTIKYSRLYVGVWGGTENYMGWADIHFNGASIVNRSLDGTGDINSDVLVSGHGVYWIIQDVTSKTSTGTNSATVYTGGEIDGRVYCIVLVTVYEDPGLPSVTYWINEGNVNLNYKGSPATDTTETTFSGSAPTTTEAWLTTVCLTGGPDDGDTLSFNANLVATDAADGSGPDWTLGYFDLESWDVTTHRQASDNKAKFDRVDDPYLHPVLAILVCGDVERTPDLTITELDAPRLADHDETFGAVEDHDYVIDVTVKNLGNGASNAGVARLYADGATVQSINVPALAGGESKILPFIWNPGVAKTYTLKVEADATDTTTESEEGNNEKTRSIVVDSSSGTADLIGPEMTFLPTKGSDSTMIQVSAINNGSKDASNFKVEYQRNGVNKGEKTVSVGAKASKIISFVDNAPIGTHTAKIILDSTNAVTESNEYNNDHTQPFNVVTIEIICSNTANDEYTTGELFNITKRVPEETTPFHALESVADVNTRGLSSYVYGIDGIDGSSSQRSYWYGYVNGIPMSNTPTGGMVGTYQLHDGEVVRWDYHKYIDGKYSMRPIMDFPEPFKHGFDGTVFDTTIVCPDAYTAEADNIRDRLVDAGVSNVNIVTTATAAQLENNNLILIGKITENSWLSSSNAYPEYQKIGMPVYFDGGLMHNTATGDSYSSGGVVEACDNRWAGDATYDDSGPTVWIVSGVSSDDVRDAAGILASGSMDRFWRFTFDSSWQKGDLNHDGDAADAADVTMMIQAFVGDLVPNSEYDLNGDNYDADAADVTMMIQAFVGDITL